MKLRGKARNLGNNSLSSHSVLFARGVQSMPVYLLIDINVLDQELYTEYTTQVLPLVERYGGRYLVRGNEVYPVSGNWRPERLVLVQFETMDQVQDFLACPDYQALIPLRHRASTSRSIIAEGFSDDL